MHAPDDDIRLSALLLELREDDWETPTYRQFQQAACDGKFPATQRNGLWYGNRKNKRAIAAAMGMKRRRASELTPAA
jgi:hypothetical protein